MQKVEGSSPFIRFGFSLPGARLMPKTSAARSLESLRERAVGGVEKRSVVELDHLHGGPWGVSNTVRPFASAFEMNVER